MVTHTNYCLDCMRSILINGVNSKNVPVFIKPNQYLNAVFSSSFQLQYKGGKSSVFRAWVEWDRENYKSYLTRAKREENRARKK